MKRRQRDVLLYQKMEVKSGDESIPCELYKYKNGKWQSVELPEDVQNVRDINIKKGTLYVSSVATPNWDYGENGDFKNIGGGVLKLEK